MGVLVRATAEILRMSKICTSSTNGHCCVKISSPALHARRQRRRDTAAATAPTTAGADALRFTWALRSRSSATRIAHARARGGGHQWHMWRTQRERARVALARRQACNGPPPTLSLRSLHVRGRRADRVRSTSWLSVTLRVLSMGPPSILITKAWSSCLLLLQAASTFQASN